MHQSNKGRTTTTTKNLTSSSSFGKSTTKTVSYNSLHAGLDFTNMSTNNNSSGILKKRMKEKQGPTDWTHLGLKSKYRDEDAREETWNEWKKTSTASKTLLDALHDVLPVVKVERHPVHRWYNESLDNENETSNNRTKARLLMKRFVFDVQEMWLANLEHLHEHKPDKMFTEADNSGLEDLNRGNGLENRRDVREIVALNHQIQSVSQKRAFANAYHTTRLPQVNVMLDYVPFRTPVLDGMRPLAPHVDTIISCLRAESVGNAISFIDGPVCKTTTSFSVHLQRCIPSVDYITYVSPDVFWRIQFIHSASLEQRVYVIKELDVANYVVESINSNALGYSNHLSCCVYKKDVHQFPYSDGIIEWEGSVEAMVMESPFNQGTMKPLQIIINVTLSPQDSNEHNTTDPFLLQMQLSPAEISLLFHDLNVPLFDAGWWTSNERSEVFWPRLLDQIYVGTDQVSSTYRIPTFIGVREIKTFHLVENSLSLSQAASCAYELLSVLRIVPSPQANSLPEMILPQLGQSSFRLNDVSEQYVSTVTSTHIISIPPDVSDLAWRDKAKRCVNYGAWEILLDDCSPLSTNASDLEKKAQDVPGACEIGKKGLWYPDQVRPDKEKTQVAANFFRDDVKSSTNSIVVNLTLGLETAIIFPKVFAWESFSQTPPPCTGEEAKPFPSVFTQQLVSMKNEYLKSPIEKRPSNTVIIFEAFPTEGIDYLPKDELHKPIGFKRFVPTKNKYGFREQIEVDLLKIDPHVDSHVYGITRYGAIANNIGVNSRNIWHNSIAVSEHINRLVKLLPLINSLWND